MPCHPESRAAIGFLANTFQVNRTVLIPDSKSFVPTRHKIGDVAGCAELAASYSTSGHNAYIEGRTVRPDIKVGERGSTERGCSRSSSTPTPTRGKG
jgi:hypothetical protein